jgi:ribosomal protein S18 acetylase RimI-like enzyme
METDRDTLYQIHRSAMRSYVDAVWGWDEEDQQQRFRTYVNGAGLQAIVVGSEVIGFLDVKRSDEEIRVVNIEVTPAHQGQGIGSTILGTLLGEGKKERIPVTLKSSRSMRERIVSISVLVLSQMAKLQPTTYCAIPSKRARNP